MKTWIAAFALVLAASVIPTGTSAASPPLYGPARLKVAGVAIGMTPPEVLVALKASGYARIGQTMGPAWDARVAYLLLLNRSIRVPGSGQVVSTEDYSKGEERLQVKYIPTPAGAVVSQVTYRLGWSAMNPTRFQQAVLERYGRPTRPSDNVMMYCSLGEVACTPIDLPTPTQEPNIRVEVPMRNLVLNMGARAWRDYEARLKAEMDRRAPKIKRPTL